VIKARVGVLQFLGGGGFPSKNTLVWGSRKSVATGEACLGVQGVGNPGGALVGNNPGGSLRSCPKVLV